jgi:hypothetical protein
MTSERDFDRLARAWLELGPDQAPDPAVAAILRAVDATPQVRRPFALPIRRPLAGAAVAALAIVVVGGAILLSQRNQPQTGSPATLPTAAPSPSPEISPLPSATPVEIVLQRSPANLGCDSMEPGYRSVTVRIDPASDVYVDVANPASDGTFARVNVDVWAEVDPVPSMSPGVETLRAGTRLPIYWPPGFTASGGEALVIRGLRGEEVARNGTKLDVEAAGYFSCAGRRGIYVLDNQPG